MKKSSSDFIFRLIKSLTKSEKRYFKIYSNRFTYKDKQKYLDLFDAIDKQKEYDEAALKKKFEGEKFLKHFPTVKSRLKDMVLEGLVEYQANDNNEAAVVKKAIGIAVALFSKGFLEVANNHIDKLKRRIAPNDLTLHDYIQCNNFEWLSINYESIEEIDLLYEEEKRISKRLQLFQFYRWAYNKIYAYQVKYGNNKVKVIPLIEEILQNPFFQNPPSSTTKTSTIYYYDSWAIYHTIKGDLEALFQCRKQSMNVLLANTPMEGMQDYAVIINYCSCCSITKRYEEYREGIEILEKEEREHKDRNSKNRIYYYIVTLNFQYYMLREQWENAWLYIRPIYPKLQKVYSQLSQRYMIEIYHYIIYFGVINLQFEEILSYLEKLVKIKKPTYRQMLTNLHYFYCILHYEMGNFQFLESALVSIPRYLKRNDMFTDNSKVFFSLFKKLLSAIHTSDYQKEIQLMKERLGKEISLGIGDKINQLIIYWLDAKSENFSFEEVIQKRYYL